MKHARRRPLVTVLLAGLAVSSVAAQETQWAERARREIEAGDFGKAVSICLDGLRESPGDFELRFLLARSHAYAGGFDEAEMVLDRLLEDHPENADLVLLKARIDGWRGSHREAEAGFRKVLEADPGNGEALAGLADLYSWEEDWDAALEACRRAVDADPGNAAVLFRMGTLHERRGEHGEARACFRKAAGLDPSNGTYARAMKNVSLSPAGGTEFWLAGRNESFSDGRSDYSDLEAAFKFGLFDDRAPVILKAARAWRFGEHDDRLGIEAYPRLWKGAYGYVDLILSPAGGFSPDSSLHVEVFQSVLPWMEVSLGARRMAFPGGGVSMLAGSLGAYWGKFHSTLRTFAAFGEGESEFTWIAGLRRYFSRTNFVWAGVGHGSRSIEGVSVGDLLGGRSWLGEAGADLTVLRHVRLRGVFALRRESTGLTSTSLSLVAGTRW
jgi:YaiO family outer membrane protein